MSHHTGSKSVYTGVSLDPKTASIRLLEILDDKAGTIVCRFHRIRLEDAPGYTALSYTWGSAQEAKELLIDGTRVSVRQNVWNFLQQTRRGRTWRFIWIDALCIDQDNPAERNHQVKMMRAIYSSADIVTVWLGEAADDSDLAMRYIERLAEGSVSGRRPCTWKQGRAIYALAERRYWKRIWIVQEIMLAKDILVFCGERSVPWSCFSMLQEHLQNVQNYGRMEHIPFAWPVFGSAALRIVSKRSAWNSLPLETIGLPIEDVLENFADMESTELKDKVYALLGIIQPFEDGSRILIDYSKTTAAIYRDVLRNVFYHRENLDVPAKQRFKKLLKESLGLSAIDVMEREPTTEARILIGVENCGPMIIKTMETQAIERFRSRESELDVPLRKAIAEIVECGDLPWIWEYRIKAIHTTAIEPETKPLLEQVAERERIAAMDNAEPMLLAALKKHLKNSFELGVETTMRWVRESRFEVESVRDEALDWQMEIRMMRLLETHIERHAKPSIQSAMDAAIRSAKMSAIAQTRLTMRQLPGSVAERWRHEYIAAWICKWRRGGITLWSTGLWGRIDRWLDDWYIRQLEDMITRMSLTTMAKEYITEHQRSYLMDTNVRYYFFPTASNRRDRVLRIEWNRRDGINEDYPSHQLSHILEWYDYRFKDIVLEAIRHWHLKNGVFDPSSTEMLAEIKERVNRLLQSGLSDA